jgi:predicted RND superfamily exporter protein
MRKFRPVVYSVASVLILVALFGLFRIQATGYIVDDIPHDTKEYNDLEFFEKHFSGVMPFEIVVNTHKIGKATQFSTIREINKIQQAVDQFPEFSKPISIAEGLKYITQTYYNGNPDKYRLPSGMEKNFIIPYLSNAKQNQKQLVRNFLDSSRKITKIDVRMKDVGSSKLPVILDTLKEKVNEKVDTSAFDISYTGTSVIFLEGNQYLIRSLIHSLLIAFLLIAFIMGLLFRSFKMLIICLIPNLIPLIITAGIMGYFQIPLKPSTVLVFSVAFGIAVDTSIHFLAKYQQEIHRHNWEISHAVYTALQETGRSMIYNSLILFFGFVIFSASSFGGTRALGILTSITLVVAMFTNTVLLPSFLLSLEWYNNNNGKGGSSALPGLPYSSDRVSTASQASKEDAPNVQKPLKS